jgi:hypothetical protein
MHKPVLKYTARPGYRQIPPETSKNHRFPDFSFPDLSFTGFLPDQPEENID